MNKDEQDYKKFLEEQLEWCKKQNTILEKIEMKLYEMKQIAEYVLKHKLTSVEVEELNDQLKELKSEVHFLEKQLHFIVH